MKTKIYSFISILSIAVLAGCSSDPVVTNPFTLKNTTDEIIGSFLSTPYSVDFLIGETNGAGAYETYTKPIGVELPKKVDLRERGYVSPVKDQGHFGTCWAFSSLASLETSLLRNENKTYQQFYDAKGYEVDLSPKHLAYYSSTQLPKVDGNTFYPYPNIESQAGEGGVFNYDLTSDVVYNFGGYFRTAANELTNGIGANFECDYPYLSNEGNYDFTEDWNLDEKERFNSSVELTKMEYLPNPVYVDKDGKATYRPEAANAVKNALNENNVVSICFYYTSSTGEPTEADNTKFLNKMKDIMGTQYNLYTEDEYLLACRVYYNDPIFDTLTKEEQTTSLEILTYFIFKVDTVTEDMLPATYLAVTDYVHGFRKDTNAFYVNEHHKANHGVCIVGYDDNYSKNNFLEGHIPEGDGAWIVKNSWASDWGNDGYFYLSYYDNTASDFAIFDGKIKENNSSKNVYSYEFTNSSYLQTAVFDEETKQANVFKLSNDGEIESLVYETSLENVEVTSSIVLLKDGNVANGETVYTANCKRENPGVYREYINLNRKFNKGDKLAIVIEQKRNNKYLVNSTLDLGEDYFDSQYNTDFSEESIFVYRNAIVNEGESLIYKNGHWVDWANVRDTLYSNNRAFTRDNFSIKMTTK